MLQVVCGLHALTFRFLGMSDWTSANRGLSPCQIAYRSEIAVVSLFLQNQFGLCTFYPKPLLENPSRSPKPTGFLQLQLWLHTTSNEQDDHGTTNAIFGQYATYLKCTNFIQFSWYPLVTGWYPCGSLAWNPGNRQQILTVYEIY